MKITVDGQEYKVIKTVPYMQIGMVAKVVGTPSGEKVAVKRGGIWEWWTALDRIQPLCRAGERIRRMTPGRCKK